LKELDDVGESASLLVERHRAVVPLQALGGVPRVLTVSSNRSATRRFTINYGAGIRESPFWGHGCWNAATFLCQ